MASPSPKGGNHMRVHNRDGMDARCSYVVYSSSNELVAIDLVGAETQVKAIAASLASGNLVWIEGAYSPFKYTGRVAFLREVLRESPPLLRWHAVPALSENDPLIPVFGWDSVLPKTDAFVGAVARWTIWPVLPEWGEPLLVSAARSGFIRPLQYFNMDYAFLIDTTKEWDELINGLLRQGIIRPPEPDR